MTGALDENEKWIISSVSFRNRTALYDINLGCRSRVKEMWWSAVELVGGRTE